MSQKNKNEINDSPDKSHLVQSKSVKPYIMFGFTILLLILLATAWIVQKNKTNRKNDLSVLTTAPAIMPSEIPTSLPTLALNPKLCKRVSEIKSIIESSNYLELKNIFEWKKSEIDCSDSSLAETDPWGYATCSAKNEYDMPEGYDIRFDESDRGGLHTLNALNKEFSDYNNKNGPFILRGISYYHNSVSPVIFFSNPKKQYDNGLKIFLNQNNDFMIKSVLFSSIYPVDIKFLQTCENVTPSPIFPDFSKETVKPKTNIDISTWKTFDDPKVGLRFKYPPEWKDFLANFWSDDPSYYKDAIIYYGHIETTNYKFGGNRFKLWGQNKEVVDLGEGGGENFTGIDTANKFCSNQKLGNILFCVHENNQAHVLIGDSKCRGGGCGLIWSYIRFMYIFTPNKRIPYFKFSGEFLSEKYSRLIRYNNLDKFYPTDEEFNILNQAILDRRLDEESMKNYDTIEKVFETVESY